MDSLEMEGKLKLSSSDILLSDRRGRESVLGVVVGNSSSVCEGLMFKLCEEPLAVGSSCRVWRL